MNDTSRRKFLAVASAGAAAGTVSLTTGTAAAAAPQGSGREPVVAYIEQPWSDQLVLMVGEREVEVRDRDLVRRILAAAGGK